MTLYVVANEDVKDVIVRNMQRSDEKFSYECIERIYDEMYGAKYFHYLDNNCKQWCEKFWAKLLLRGVIFGFLSNANE